MASPTRHRVFVTGTDTDVGKTEVALALLHLAKQHQLSTMAMKPVAAGCEPFTDSKGKTDSEVKTEWRNIDAVRLQQQCSIPLSYSEVNPVALQKAIAPHLAAFEEKRTISIDRLVGFTQNIFGKKADFTVIEGAGGWRVPVSHRELLSQYVQQLNLLQPKTHVVLVVGIRLGCLNHALLTVEAIMRDNVPFAGWIANCIDEHMMMQLENIQTLERLLPAPCLGVIPFHSPLRTETVAAKIDFALLMKRLDS
jgi:dethiobiotin synthetase